MKNQINNPYFENLFNYSNVPIVIWGKNFKIGRFNSAFEKLTGRKEEAVVGKSIRILFPESSADTTMEIIKKAQTCVRIENTEIDILHKNGFVNTVLWNSVLILDDDGVTIVATIGQGQDITKHKQTEKKLQISEHFLLASQNISKIGSYVLDIPTGKWKGSEELERIFGLSANDDHNIESWTSIIHPYHKNMMADYFALEVIGKGKRFDKEYKIINQQTQQEIWVHGIGELEFGNNNVPIKMRGTIQDINERKKNAEALYKSEQRMKSFVNDSLLCIYFLNIETKKIIYANPSFFQLLGYLPEDIESLKIYDFVNHSNVSIDSFLENVWQTKLRNIGKRQWKTKDGKLIEMLVNATYSNQNDSKIIYVSAQDITELEKTEKAIIESEKHLKRGEMVAKFGNWKLLVDEQIIYASEGAQKIYGINKNELAAEEVRKFVLPEYRKKNIEALHALIYESKLYNLEFKIKREVDGTIVDIHSLAEYDPATKTVFGIIQDITERKKAEKNIVNSEKKFKSVLQSAKDSIVLANAKGEIIFWNHFAEKIFGYTENEVLGKPLALIMPERYRAAHLHGFEKHVSSDQKKVIDNIFEMHGLKKNGQEFPLELTLSNWTNENEKFYCGIIRDITERKDAEKEQKRHIQKLSEIAYLQSHQVRAPIASILGLINLIDFENPACQQNFEVLHNLKKTSTMCDIVIKKIVDKTSEIDELNKNI